MGDPHLSGLADYTKIPPFRNAKWTFRQASKILPPISYIRFSGVPRVAPNFLHSSPQFLTFKAEFAPNFLPSCPQFLTFRPIRLSVSGGYSVPNKEKKNKKNTRTRESGGMPVDNSGNWTGCQPQRAKYVKESAACPCEALRKQTCCGPYPRIAHVTLPGYGPLATKKDLTSDFKTTHCKGAHPAVRRSAGCPKLPVGALGTQSEATEASASI